MFQPQKGKSSLIALSNNAVCKVNNPPAYETYSSVTYLRNHLILSLAYSFFLFPRCGVKVRP